MADGGREINDVMNDVKIGGGFRCFLEKNSRMLLIIVAAFLTVIIAFQLNRIIILRTFAEEPFCGGIHNF